MTNVLTRRGGALLERCRRWFSRYFAGAEPALCQMALAISALVAGVTLAAASTVEKGFEGNGGNIEAAKKVGAAIAERALKKGIEDVVFDRGGYIYHGRVKALAEGAREGGLKF